MRLINFLRKKFTWLYCDLDWKTIHNGKGYFLHPITKEYNELDIGHDFQQQYAWMRRIWDILLLKTSLHWKETVEDNFAFHKHIQNVYTQTGYTKNGPTCPDQKKNFLLMFLTTRKINSEYFHPEQARPKCFLPTWPIETLIRSEWALWRILGPSFLWGFHGWSVWGFYRAFPWAPSRGWFLLVRAFKHLRFFFGQGECKEESTNDLST